MLYRTQENVIDGVVITFTDVSASRALARTMPTSSSTVI
jgi:hypothetical protein